MSSFKVSPLGPAVQFAVTRRPKENGRSRHLIAAMRSGVHDFTKLIDTVAAAQGAFP